MATLEQVKSYLGENETHCWRLFARREYAKDMIGEYMAPQPDPKESLDRLEKQARMYEEMYPGTEFLVEPRRSATSNKSGVFSSLSFRLSEGPSHGHAGLAGTQPPGGYITKDELARHLELVRKESELDLKRIQLENEFERKQEQLRQKARGLGSLRKKYGSKTEAFQNALEQAFMGVMSGLGLISEEEETREESQPPAAEGNPKLQRLNELATLVNGLTRSPEEVEMVTEIIRKTVEKQRNAHAEP